MQIIITEEKTTWTQELNEATKDALLQFIEDTATKNADNTITPKYDDVPSLIFKHLEDSLYEI